MDLIEDIKAGNTKKVRSLAEDPEKFAQDIQFVDSDGMTSLHYACKHGYLPIVKLILSSENPQNLVNLQDKKQGWTPLIHSVYSQDDGGPEIVTQLLDKGADPKIKDNEGNTALHHAAAYGAGDVVEFLAKHKGTDLNMQNNIGETPAHLAIKESQMWGFQTLLKAGCRVDLNTFADESLAHYAVKSIGNAPQFLRILQSKGLSLSLKDKEGKTPFGYAKEKNLSRVLKALEDLGIKGEAVSVEKTKTANKVENGNEKRQVLNKKEKTLEDKLKMLIYILVILLIPVLVATLFKVSSSK